MLLRGLDGANPLGFLAAIGTARLLSSQESQLRLRWVRDGAWRPELSGLPTRDADELCARLLECKPAPVDAIRQLGKNITVSAVQFGEFVRAAASAAEEDRCAADFAASFGSEVCWDEKKGRIYYTDLCFITGSGHQDFILTMAELQSRVGVQHLQEALFGPWRYSDSSLSMRWDPADASEYALQWNDPSSEGVTTVWGANRLAIEALPLFPAQPVGDRIRTTGFRRNGRVDEFTWPVWTHPISVDSIRSLLASSELQAVQPDREKLRLRGVEDIFRVQRVRIGAGANFKVSFRPSRAV
ncbi:MAG: type I-G CRISPR-associated protein, Cas3-extension family [Bryobacteraceae bacterium]